MDRNTSITPALPYAARKVTLDAAFRSAPERFVRQTPKPVRHQLAKAGWADPMLAAKVSGRNTSFLLLDHADDLRLGETALSHLSAPEQDAEKGFLEPLGSENLPLMVPFMRSWGKFQAIADGFFACGCHDPIAPEFFSSLLEFTLNSTIQMTA